MNKFRIQEHANSVFVPQEESEEGIWMDFTSYENHWLCSRTYTDYQGAARFLSKTIKERYDTRVVKSHPYEETEYE